MNFKAADRNVLHADNPGQTGTAMEDYAIVAKRKYVPPRCHCLMSGDTEAGKTSAPGEST